MATRFRVGLTFLAVFLVALMMGALFRFAVGFALAFLLFAITVLLDTQQHFEGSIVAE
ncbi:MAG: hypothetical protein WAK55_02820 [Xanthobacteraceae bacterium]